MPSAATRAVLRPSRLVFRRAPLRNASSTSEAASNTAAKAKETASNTAGKAKETASNTATKAKETASQATSKASEGLSRVQSAASSTASKAGEAASAAANKASGRVAGLIGFVQSMIPPTIYYSKVGLEMGKLIFHGQKMAPPNGAQLQTYYQRAVQTLRNPSNLMAQNQTLANPQQAMQNVRNISSQQMTTAAIVAAELLGFFTIGEMIGKLKIVGYRGKVEHH